MISTVGDLIAALQRFDPAETVALAVAGRRMRFPRISEEVCQDAFTGPAPIYIYSYDRDEPVFNVVFIGDDLTHLSKHNRAAHKARGETVLYPDDVRAMSQLDPKPYVYTDPVSSNTTRLAKKRDDVKLEFKPRRGFAQDEASYEG